VERCSDGRLDIYTGEPLLSCRSAWAGGERVAGGLDISGERVSDERVSCAGSSAEERT